MTVAKDSNKGQHHNHSSQPHVLKKAQCEREGKTFPVLGDNRVSNKQTQLNENHLTVPG